MKPSLCDGNTTPTSILSLRAAAPPPAAPDVAGQLMELKRLLDAGALSPEEFQAAKRKVLDG